jgi:hypothetical protein
MIRILRSPEAGAQVRILPGAPPRKHVELTLTGDSPGQRPILRYPAESGAQRRLAGVHAQYAPKPGAADPLCTDPLAVVVRISEISDGYLFRIEAGDSAGAASQSNWPVRTLVASGTLVRTPHRVSEPTG